MKDQIVKNLKLNGFPEKSVSLPLEKLYEVADKKNVNLNKILEELEADGISYSSTTEKIIFSQKVADNFSGVNPEMMKKAQEMMGQMTPEQIQEIQEKVANMSDEERQALMNQAKSMGLF